MSFHYSATARGLADSGFTVPGGSFMALGSLKIASPVFSPILNLALSHCVGVPAFPAHPPPSVPQARPYTELSTRTAFYSAACRSHYPWRCWGRSLDPPQRPHLGTYYKCKFEGPVEIQNQTFS